MCRTRRELLNTNARLPVKPTEQRIHRYTKMGLLQGLWAICHHSAVRKAMLDRSFAFCRSGLVTW